MPYEQHVQYGIIENYFRNNIIKNLAKKYGALGKVLIIIDRIEHGETLAQELDCDFIWGSHSIDYRERIFKEFDQGDKQLLIANKIVGEGINIKNIKYLIYAAGYKAYTRIIQHSGRALTKKEYGENNAVIIDFADTFSKYLSEHSEERINIYKGTGYQVLYEDPYEYLDDSLLDLYKEHSRLKKDRFIQNVDTSINDIENKLSKLLNSDNRV
jgi:superfamily II DNA or RNA helicase